MAVLILINRTLPRINQANAKTKYIVTKPVIYYI